MHDTRRAAALQRIWNLAVDLDATLESIELDDEHGGGPVGEARALLAQITEIARDDPPADAPAAADPPLVFALGDERLGASAWFLFQGAYTLGAYGTKLDRPMEFALSAFATALREGPERAYEIWNQRVAAAPTGA